MQPAAWSPFAAAASRAARSAARHSSAWVLSRAAASVRRRRRVGQRRVDDGGGRRVERGREGVELLLERLRERARPLHELVEARRRLGVRRRRQRVERDGGGVGERAHRLRLAAHALEAVGAAREARARSAYASAAPAAASAAARRACVGCHSSSCARRAAPARNSATSAASAAGTGAATPPPKWRGGGASAAHSILTKSEVSSAGAAGDGDADAAGAATSRRARITNTSCSMRRWPSSAAILRDASRARSNAPRSAPGASPAAASARSAASSARGFASSPRCRSSSAANAVTAGATAGAAAAGSCPSEPSVSAGDERYDAAVERAPREHFARALHGDPSQLPTLLVVKSAESPRCCPLLSAAPARMRAVRRSTRSGGCTIFRAGRTTRGGPARRQTHLYVPNAILDPILNYKCQERIPRNGKYNWRIVRDEYPVMMAKYCPEPYDVQFAFEPLQGDV